MGKKKVKSGSVLGYLWMLIGIVLLAVSVMVHLKAIPESMQEYVSFAWGDDKAVFHYVGMGVGALLLLIGFFNKPRKAEKK